MLGSHPKPDLSDSSGGDFPSTAGAAIETPETHISPPGPGQLPRVYTQCHGSATEPGHDPCHPQALVWGYTTGEQGTHWWGGWGRVFRDCHVEPSLLSGCKGNI